MKLLIKNLFAKANSIKEKAISSIIFEKLIFTFLKRT